MENQLTPENFKAIAKQLGCPEGEHGIKTGEAMNITNKGMIQAAINVINPQNNDHILEIGHGNAGHLKFLFSKAEDLYYQGVDISETIFTEAKKINREYIEKGLASFALTSGQTLPFKNESFNKIFTVNTLYFWKNPPVYLAEIKRVLKPGGLFVLCFADKAFMEKLPFTPYGFNLYDLEEGTNLLKTSGFTILNQLTNAEEVKTSAGETVTRDYFVLVAQN